MIYKNYLVPQLFELLNKLKSQTFSIQTQYKFIKINKVIQTELEIRQEQEHELILNYAERDENGTPIALPNGGIKIKKELYQQCLDKVNELNTITITLPDIYFSLEELEKLELTLGELELLEPFIKD